ncbi:Methylthioribose-1-phosphate isomerase [Lachnellula subtilissima]|uniref:Methylthioribose-1-phosphate isomerase n=1 Tax=Lachnellula subtilissima TaxID=602034 RepID=A0A8H8RPF6_9HELO|nr:Methylthioribose-1-phosphate isomerase [Lachnellula subtilissima]
MVSHLRQRAVVSSFICTPPESPSGFTFALFKRSQQVSTYPGKWAVCSGSIDPTDPSPEDAAKREILEETTLSDADIFLLRKGKPFSLVDEALRTEWTIHPFAWQLKDGAKPIKFDWEHTEYHFIKPAELDSMDHVPQLEVGLSRILVSPETGKDLAVLRDDHESGAKALALKALELLLKAVQSGELASLSTCEEFWKELRWRAWHLAKNGRPSMGAAIEAVLFRTLENIRQMFLTSPDGVDGVLLSLVRSGTEAAIKATIEAKKQALEGLAVHFAELVESRHDNEVITKIVTLSSSGTVTQSLATIVKRLALQNLSVKLSVLESRPKFEGVAFVNTLLKILEEQSGGNTNLEVEIVSDASVSTVVADADYLIFGGDKVIPNGDVSNKIGSLTAAIVAKTLNPKCSVVALFETDKITGSGFDAGHMKVEYNDEAEVMDAWPTSAVLALEMNQKLGYHVKVKNAYFDWVPAKYIDHYISEQGLLSRENIEQQGTESEELEKRIFGDL